LGNLDSKRDWGFAPEYCEGMWQILQHNKADDFVLATGETHTVREFVERTFSELGVELLWQNSGESEKGIIKSIDFGKAKLLIDYSQNLNKYRYNFSTDLKAGDVVVGIDSNSYRPTEVDLLIGNPQKANQELGWKAKTKFEDLVKLMIKADLDKILKRGY
jgi:GDPmannose 4,6-dehydratase